MIEDAVPEEYRTSGESARWAVLVEEESTMLGDTRWVLARREDVTEGGRAAAEELARKLAMEHVPREVRPLDGATAGRRVFRVSDGSWLVDVRGAGSATALCRITTAEQVHVQPFVAAPREKAAPPAKPRRLFGLG
ncbi:hypothetical protein [Streptomyces sp. NPDC056144]|uniref:hypothetical protein n=1 Tax=unclassified Streptomyces TaxID=2593676 RepID=UPI0035D78D53